MNKTLSELIRISNTTGKDSTLVAGGGGNTSVKTDDGQSMYIKASGTALKDMSEAKGWRRLRIEEVRSIVEDKALGKQPDSPREIEVVRRLLAACDDDVSSGARPSVEAHLHALLEKVVIHLHPLSLAAYVSAKDGQDRLARLFKDDRYPPLWVGYADPGFRLASKMAKLIKQYEQAHGRRPQVMFLEKHGLFVTADSANKALRLVREVMRRLDASLKSLKSPMLRVPDAETLVKAKLAIRSAVFQATGGYQCVSYYLNETVARFMAHRNAGSMLATPALNPDELVYANGSAMWVEKLNADSLARKITNRVDRGSKVPAAFLVKGLGLFVAGAERTAPLIAEITTGSLFVREHASRFGGINALTRRQEAFINNWESESFRKQQAGSASDGELKGRVAVVTGAGSGLGRAVAIGMARAGALVALADIDTTAAEETLTMITREIPGAGAMVTRCNVTDETSVQDAYQAILARWGGFDLLVNAAGVAPAYPLTEFEVDKWRFALEVNLTGYLLMAKHAARALIAQGIGGAIVNLSSKSGIEASKNNSAYNATKAGELHLTRGWAMELGQHGIRVNSVCPGNVFEGSKIWNPTYIRECAKKYGIRPEEVIPFYVDRTMLKQEIMGQDIAESVVFLCGEKSRRITGQTLVTDAGQALVR